MSQMSDYLENKLVDHILRTASYTKPTALAIALFTAAPNDAAGGTEVSGNAYARVSLNPLDANWTATQGGTTGVSSGTGGQTSNAALLTFPTPTPAGWGTVTHWVMFDAATAGNVILYGTLTASKVINAGDAVTFPVGSIVYTFA